MSPFEFVKAINQTKKDIMSGTENDQLAEKGYVPYVINKSLSYFPDTVLHANRINMHHGLDNRMQFSYLLNSIRPGKRFSKWVKHEDSDDLQVVKDYFGYGHQKASQALALLSREQLSKMRDTLQKGGMNDQHY